MKVKRAKLQAQLRALPRTPQAHFTIAAANAKRAEIEPLIAYGFNGNVVQAPTGKPLPPEGKAKRTHDTRTYGNYQRRGAVLTPDVYAPAGQCLIVRRADTLE